VGSVLSHVVPKGVQVFGEGRADSFSCKSEILRLVDMLTSRSWSIVGGPCDQRGADRSVQVEAGMFVHEFCNSSGISRERSLAHVEKSVLAQHGSSRKGLPHTVEIVLENLGADCPRIEGRTGEPPPTRRQNHAASGRHGGHRIAMGHDEPGLGVVRRELW
jgi:hypothetical protein